MPQDYPGCRLKDGYTPKNGDCKALTNLRTQEDFLHEPLWAHLTHMMIQSSLRRIAGVEDSARFARPRGVMLDKLELTTTACSETGGLTQVL